jgi:hypothetical protein
MGNLIGFAETGIVLDGRQDRVLGNYIGDDGRGHAFPNRTGILARGENHDVIGNVIANNEFQVVADNSPGLAVVGNFIGLQDCSNILCRVPPQYVGIQIQGEGTSSIIQSNTVAHHLYEGIRIGEEDDRTDGVQIDSNWIFDNGKEGKGLIGVDLPFGSFKIDGAQREAFDRYAGIHIVRGSQNLIARNSIYQNYGPSILLGQAYTDGSYQETLDPGDLDDGPNTLLNYPVWAVGVGPGVALALGVYYGAPNQQFRIELYVSDSGADEAEQFYGEFLLTTDPDGTATFRGENTQTILRPGQFLTATATDGFGNTSEVGRATMVQSLEDQDQDGMSDGVEDQVPAETGQAPAPRLPGLAGVEASPAKGDGNGDGIPDSQQPNIASFPSMVRTWVTVAVAEGARLADISPVPDKLPQLPAGFVFPVGAVGFSVSHVPVGSVVQVTNRIHASVQTGTVFVLGSTQDDPHPHWVEFNFDGTTGAAVTGGNVVLSVMDGGRGDRDATPDGVIRCVFAPAFRPPAGLTLELLSHSVTNVPQVRLVRSETGILSTTNQVPVVITAMAWPDLAVDGTLESTDQLTRESVWRPVSQSPVLLGNQWVVTNASLSPQRYYRLRQR